MDLTPTKWSERERQRKLRNKGKKKAGEGDSDSDGGMTEFSIRPNGVRLSKHPHVVHQRIKWKEYRDLLDSCLEEPSPPKRRFGPLCKVATLVACLVAGACIIVLLPNIQNQLQDYWEDFGEVAPVSSPGIQLTWQEGQTEFRRAVKTMKDKYPRQTRETWVQLLSSVSATLTENPQQPSSLVLLTPPDIDSGFTPCLAREVGRNAHSVFYNVTRMQFTRRILELDSNDFNNAASVTEIHDKLHTYLKNGKVVVIKNPHLISDPDPERLMVLHAFCDNSAAPYKQATFLFVVPVPARIYGKYGGTHADAAEMANEVLSAAWGGVSLDKRPALIARVAAAAVIIKPGDRCVDE